MAGLRVAITALALLAAAPADAQSVVHWRPYIEAASARFGVPVEWIERVMRAESGGRTVLDGPDYQPRRRDGTDAAHARHLVRNARAARART
ncbi:hypothetical protein [Hankyongella ginsenosidimutans]|uniref:hypothetical protein n=1 Tax=Hankyongella ginsenosidimutans TaxID=1763828 RepID=UPI003CCC4B9E